MRKRKNKVKCDNKETNINVNNEINVENNLILQSESIKIFSVFTLENIEVY